LEKAKINMNHQKLKYNILSGIRKISVLESYIITIIILYTFSISAAVAQNGNQKWGIPSNLTILNSDENDYGAHLNKFQNILYFNSEREGKSYFYSTLPGEGGGFTEPKFLKSAINIRSQNQSYISVPNESEAYFSTYRKSGRQSYLNIYRTIFQKNNWTSAFPVDSLIIDAFCSHVTVSPNGNIMVFSSTNSSSTGDIDLWMSYRNENGQWGTPVAVDELNSQGNEITSYLQADDTLYFASDGYEGPGGYDIYISTRSGGKWNRPKPVYDLNTEFNESDFTILEDGRAVFASDRPGGHGLLDLYIVSPLTSNYAGSAVRLPDISIRTQVSSIVAEKRSIISRYPAFYFFVRKSFEMTNSNYPQIIDSLLVEYPSIIAAFLKNNPSEILVIDSSSINNSIISFFNSKGIGSDRIIIQKTFAGSDIIKCRLLSGNPLPIPEISESTYNYKPRVIEISIDSRDTFEITKHYLTLVTDRDKHEIQLSDKKLPLRDIISLEEYDSEVYDSDSVIINYKILSGNQVLSESNRTLYVSHQQIKETRLIIDSTAKFEEYFLVIPDNIFFNSDYFSGDYFQSIIESSINAKSIKIEFYNDLMKSQAAKIKELLSSKITKKGFEIVAIKKPYIENQTFSKDLADLIVRILVIK